jgi:hypothetical protein
MVLDEIARARKGATRRAKQAVKKTGLTPRGPVYGRLVDAGRAVPIPPKARVVLSTALLRRPGRITVPVDRLLLGAQAGWTAREFADRTQDLLWASTRVVDGPHVGLLRLPEPTDEEILASPYGRMARRCVDAGGTYFGAADDAGIIASARRFRSGEAGERRPEQSGRLDPILVAPVRGTGYYQVLDGHHRLARAVADGETSVRVVTKWLPVTTPLQDLLLRMSWIDGNKELYQPLTAPELEEGWSTVRRCTDRLEKMRAFLSERGITGSYLDVASCYGWFVSEMGKAGFDASGIERDPLAVPLGRAAYGLREGQISTGDAVELLTDPERTWDVVSCFSLLHHFALGRASVGAEELAGLLDGVTAKVLFLDTGQENESWFRTSLAGWDPEMIADFLRSNTGFDEVIDLGPDDDARPPYADNYGRHLFACVRT